MQIGNVPAALKFFFRRYIHLYVVLQTGGYGFPFVSNALFFKEVTMAASQILSSEPMDLPLLPLRDVVVFPHMVIPLFVGRPRSIKALELAMEAGNNIMLIAQKSAGKDDPTPEDLYEIGCAASILQMLKLPNGPVKVLEI